MGREDLTVKSATGSLCLLLLLSVGAEAGEALRYADYAVADRLSGKPAAVDLASDPEARRFRTRLREGAAEGPNFAGHFTIVSWHCGTDCQVLAVVDARSGAVTFAPFLSEFGQEFRIDSRLLITNPPSEIRKLLDDPGVCPAPPSLAWVTTRYFEWNGEEFRFIAEKGICPNSG